MASLVARDTHWPLRVDPSVATKVQGHGLLPLDHTRCGAAAAVVLTDRHFRDDVLAPISVADSRVNRRQSEVTAAAPAKCSEMALVEREDAAGVVAVG